MRPSCWRACAIAPSARSTESFAGRDASTDAQRAFSFARKLLAHEALRRFCNFRRVHGGSAKTVGGFVDRRCAHLHLGSKYKFHTGFSFSDRWQFPSVEPFRESGEEMNERPHTGRNAGYVVTVLRHRENALGSGTIKQRSAREPRVGRVFSRSFHCPRKARV